MLRDKGKSSGLAGKLIGAAAGAVIGLTSLLMPRTADASTININPITYPTYSDVQNGRTVERDYYPGLNDAAPGDYVYITGSFTDPDSTLPFGASYNLKAGIEGSPINYVFNATMSGSGGAHGMILGILGGGYINISKVPLSNGLILNNARVGIGIDNAVVYKGINISGVTFNVSEDGVVMENLDYGSPADSAAVSVSYSIMRDMGRRLIRFMGNATANSPPPSATNNTVRGLTGDNARLMDVPKYWDGTKYVLLSGNEIAPIEKNILVNVPELSNNADYVYFTSPNDNAYDPLVTSPYLKEPVPVDTPDSVGNVVLSDFGLIPGTPYPEKGVSPLDLGDTWIGAYMPRYRADVTLDDFIGGDDLTWILTNWGKSGMSWEEGDLNGDGFIGGDDYTEVLTYWGTGIPPGAMSGHVPEPATLSLFAAAGLVRILAGKRKRK